MLKWVLYPLIKFSLWINCDCECEDFFFISRFNVRVVTSIRGGMGKSLFIEKKSDQLNKHLSHNCTPKQKDRFQNYQMVVRTPVHGTTVGYNNIVSNLSSNCIFDDDFPRIYHFDVALTVRIIKIKFYNNFMDKKYQ